MRSDGLEGRRAVIDFGRFYVTELRARDVTGQRKVSSTFNVMCNRLVRSVYNPNLTLIIP
jgi:hypothetical protein